MRRRAECERTERYPSTAGLLRPTFALAGNALTIVSKHCSRWDHRARLFEDKEVKYNIAMVTLVAVFTALGSGAKADDFMLDDGHRIAFDLKWSWYQTQTHGPAYSFCTVSTVPKRLNQLG
jgi:hypothetical protein